jgi:hypothetical protein
LDDDRVVPVDERLIHPSSSTTCQRRRGGSTTPRSGHDRRALR